MAIDIGTAEGHIILDTSGFIVPLQNARTSLSNFGSELSMKVGAALQTLGSTMQTVGNTITRYLSEPLQNFAKSAFSEMVEFEDGMNRAGAIAKASAEEMAALTEKAKEMGRTTKFSATEATKALQYMGMAGWDADQMISGLEGIMNLAAASGEDLAVVSDIVTDALTAMGLKASDSAHFADVLTAATLNSNTTVGMLGEAFKYVAPVAGTLNYSIEDLALALGLMANAGIKGTQAGAGLRTSLQRMSVAPGQVAVEMEKLGLSMYNTDRTAKPLSQLMEEIREKFRGLDQQTRITTTAIIFGARQMSNWSAIIMASEEDFNRLQKVLKDSEGLARKTAERMLESFAGRITLLQSAISGFKLQFAQDVLPFFTTIVNKLIDIIGKVSTLDDTTRKMVLAFVAVGAAIGPLVAGFGAFVAILGGALVSLGLIAASITSLAALIGVSTVAVTGLGAAIAAALAAAPVLIAALIAAFVDLMANNEDFYNDVMSAINDIKLAFNSLKIEFNNVLEEMGLADLSFVDLVLIGWAMIKNTLAPLLRWIVAQVKICIESVAEYIEGWLNVFEGSILIAKGEILDGISKIFVGIAGMFEGAFGGLVKSIGASVSAVVDLFGVFGATSDDVAKRVTKAAEKSAIAWTDYAKQHAIYQEKVKKGEIETTENLVEQTQKRLEAEEEALKKSNYDLEKDREYDLQSEKVWAEKHVGNFDAASKEIKQIVKEQRTDLTTEAGKTSADLIEIGDNMGSGFVGIMDAHLSHLPGVFNDYFSDALDVVDDFNSSFLTSGSSAAETFVNAFIDELAKMPAAFNEQLSAITVQVNLFANNLESIGKSAGTKFANSITTNLSAVLKSTKTWASDMASAASKMASDFNNGASKTATDLTAQLKSKLNSTLGVANDWVDKMGKKGSEGAKLFLSYMLDAVNSQGAEIQKFGVEISKQLTLGIESNSDWIRDRLKSAYYKILDQMESDMGLAYKTASNMTYASNYGVGYGTITNGTAQRTTTAAASNTTANTIIFNSPKAIDEVEASRLLRKTQQDMLMGF